MDKIQSMIMMSHAAQQIVKNIDAGASFCVPKKGLILAKSRSSNERLILLLSLRM